MPKSSTYPITFSVDYPDQLLSRASTALRAILAIPVVLLAVILQGADFSLDWSNLVGSVSFALGGGGVVAVPAGLMLVTRRKYPRWWYEWNVELLRFVNRVLAYLALMSDRYPSTDEEQSVRLQLPYPERQSLSRVLPMFKWLLATPHYFVLAVLYIGFVFALFAAWIAIIVTGRYPPMLFSYVEGVLRWTNRVTGYAYALVTDEYPPFRLRP